MTTQHALRRIRALLIFFMCALMVSGLTAIPLQWELRWLISLIEKAPQLQLVFPELFDWLRRVNDGVQTGYGHYPFLAYGTDWLAFGHVAIAVAFIGPLRDPVRNLWVIEFGMIICLLVVPWVLLFGAIREIPWFWQLIDLSFGLFGIVPLWLARVQTNHLRGIN